MASWPPVDYPFVELAPLGVRLNALMLYPLSADEEKRLRWCASRLVNSTGMVASQDWLSVLWRLSAVV